MGNCNKCESYVKQNDLDSYLKNYIENNSSTPQISSEELNRAITEYLSTDYVTKANYSVLLNNYNNLQSFLSQNIRYIRINTYYQHEGQSSPSEITTWNISSRGLARRISEMVEFVGYVDRIKPNKKITVSWTQNLFSNKFFPIQISAQIQDETPPTAPWNIYTKINSSNSFDVYYTTTGTENSPYLCFQILHTASPEFTTRL